MKFQPDGNLPQGIHNLSWAEAENLLAFNQRRQELFSGIKRVLEPLKNAGCQQIYIGGSMVTSKEFPGDFDLCWDDQSTDLAKLKELEPVLLDFSRKRAAQKAKFGGESFPASVPADLAGNTYLDFFQKDRDGNPKGIICIDIQA
jgi:hypothetical protein